MENAIPMTQVQILNKILKEKDSSIITLNNLTSDFFPEYYGEFVFIKEHLDKYGILPDMETFTAKFTDFEIIEVNEPTRYLLDELYNDKTRRDLANSYNQLRPLLMSGDKEAIERALELVRETAERTNHAVVLQAHDIIHDSDSRYEAYLDMADNLDKYFTKTGFKELDDIIGGWNAKEDLVTIVARNGVGKSWILLRCACAAAMQGKTVGLYSGEMGLDNVGFRADTLLGAMLDGQGIANGSLIHGSLSIKNEYKNFLAKINERVSGHIWVITPEDIGAYGKVSTFRAFIEKYNLDILCVDQNSLLDDDKNAKNPVEKASNISTDMKLLQRLKQIPIVCVNQQNRTKNESDKTGKQQFDTTQLAQSDKIGQDSSIIIFLERIEDLMRLHLVKSRNSSSGNILTYKINLNNGSFTYVNENESNDESSANYGDSVYSDDEVF